MRGAKGDEFSKVLFLQTLTSTFMILIRSKLSF